MLFRIHISFLIVIISLQTFAEEDKTGREIASEEVIVVGRAIDNGSSSTTFNIEELIQLPGGRGDLLSTIQIISGISIPQQPGFGMDQGYHIRGSRVTDNQYIVDWLPLGYIFHYGGTLAYSVVNSSLIEGFEVILGGFAPQYSNVTGGIIDVKLRKPKDDKQHFEFKFGTEIGILTEGPLSNDASYWFALRRSYFDIFVNNFNLIEGDDQFSFQTFPEFYDAQGRLHFDTDSGFLDLTFIVSNDRIGVIIREDTDPAVLGSLQSNNGFQVAGLRWIDGVEGEFQSSQYLSFINNYSNFNIGTQLATDPNPGQPFTLNSDVASWQYDGRYEFFLDSENNILFGTLLRSSEIKVNGYIIAPPVSDSGNVFTGINESSRSMANENNQFDVSEFYFNYRYRSQSDIIFSAGFRTFHADYETNISGNDYQYSGISDRYRLEIPFEDAKNKFYILYGNYIQPQTGLDLSESFGNPSQLDLINSRHSVLGFSGFTDADWYFKVELWNKFSTGLSVADDSDCVRCTDDTAIGRSQGVDIEFRKTFGEFSSLYLALSISEGLRRNQPGESYYSFSGDQPLSLNASFSDKIYTDDHWVWGIRMIWHDGQPFTAVVDREVSDSEVLQENGLTEIVSGFNPIYGDYNGRQLPYYLQFDLSFRFSNPNSNYSYKIELNSVSDFIRGNTNDFDYGEMYENINNPQPENEAFFFPTFIVEYKF